MECKQHQMAALETYKKTWRGYHPTATTLTNAVKTMIDNFDPLSKLWKVYRCTASTDDSEPVLLCSLPAKYFDGFRLLNRYFEVSYHTHSALQRIVNDGDIPEAERSGLWTEIHRVDRLMRHFYHVQELAIAQLNTGNQENAEYSNARINALDIFLCTIYNSPQDVSEDAIEVASHSDSDPLLYGVLGFNCASPQTELELSMIQTGTNGRRLAKDNFCMGCSQTRPAHMP